MKKLIIAAVAFALTTVSWLSVAEAQVALDLGQGIGFQVGDVKVQQRNVLGFHF